MFNRAIPSPLHYLVRSLLAAAIAAGIWVLAFLPLGSKTTPVTYLGAAAFFLVWLYAAYATIQFIRSIIGLVLRRRTERRMFWKPAEYPEFLALPKDEQMRIVKLAMRHHAKLISFRFVGVLLLLFSAALALKLGLARSDSDPVLYWMTSPLFALLLYLYLLWEINGPLHRAVRSYLEAGA